MKFDFYNKKNFQTVSDGLILLPDRGQAFVRNISKIASEMNPNDQGTGSCRSTIRKQNIGLKNYHTLFDYHLL